MMSARQARDNRGAHKARALISNETFVMTRQARAQPAPRQARARRARRVTALHVNCLWLYTGFNPISCCYEERAQGHRCDFKWGLSWWHAKRAQRAPRQARARRARGAREASRLYMSTVSGCIPDLIQFLAVMRSAHKAPAVISNGAFHDDMTSVRPARASWGARHARAPRHGSTCQLSLAVYRI